MTINDLRLEIDNIDTEITNLFVKRLNLCRNIGEIKRKNSISISDENREQTIIERVSKIEPTYSNFVVLLFKEIFRLCKNIQTSKYFQ